MTGAKRRSEFSTKALYQALRGCGVPTAYVVAFSGGIDSTVLLHAMAHLRAQSGVPLRALHVNHSLSLLAADWAAFCEHFCADLTIPCEHITVDARPPSGESPEDWARRLRYEALGDRLRCDEMLLTAHHQDDQAETLLLQLFRGAGPRGLAAMPRIRPFRLGRLARPLLDFSRDSLHRYAVANKLRWVDDSSNADPRFDRNFLRSEIMPRLRLRWPQCAETLARAAGWQAEAATLIEDTAQQDLRELTGDHALSVRKLLSLPRSRRNAVIRSWLRQCGFVAPNEVHLRHIESDVLMAKWDSEPSVRWMDVEIRRYRDGLYARRHSSIDPERGPLVWNIEAQPELVLWGGRLHARPISSGGLCRCPASETLTVRYRRGGETCKPAGSLHTKSLKELFQSRGVPPWLRDSWPLIYCGESLAAIPGICICSPFLQQHEPGWALTWQPTTD